MRAPDPVVITAPVVSMDAVPAVMPVLVAEVSFALSVRAPLLVVILALMSMDFPACRVRAAPPLVTLIASVTVMSSLACRVTAVPDDKMPTTVLGQIVMSVEELVAKKALRLPDNYKG